MTLEEKTAQLQNRAFALIENYFDADGNMMVDSFKKLFPYGMGGINIGINLDLAT